MPKEMLISAGKYPYEKVAGCHCIWWQMEAVISQADAFSSAKKMDLC